MGALELGRWGAHDPKSGVGLDVEYQIHMSSVAPGKPFWREIGFGTITKEFHHEGTPQVPPFVQYAIYYGLQVMSGEGSTRACDSCSHMQWRWWFWSSVLCVARGTCGKTWWRPRAGPIGGALSLCTMFGIACRAQVLYYRVTERRRRTKKHLGLAPMPYWACVWRT